jgi:DNA polymerase-3 subunit delta'
MTEAANSLLKVLEEPPEYTSLILLSENPQELLPTIRSRAVQHTLGAIPVTDLEALLAARRPHLKPQDRALAARLAEGAVGRALNIELDTYLASRQDALIMLKTALGRLLEDLLLVLAGTPQLARNVDLGPELQRLASGVTTDWIDGAARALNDVEQGMRRNLLRSLSLDAMAVGLESR